MSFSLRTLSPLVLTALFPLFLSASCSGEAEDKNGSEDSSSAGAPSQGKEKDKKKSGKGEKDDESPDGTTPTRPKGSTVCATDKDCRAQEQLCDTERLVCVDCLVSEDCGEGGICQQGSCLSVPTCKNSLDCRDPNLVCVRETAEEKGFCLECGSNSDCGSEEVCVQNSCRTSCASDKACTSQGLLCDSKQGHCVSCVGELGCEAGEYCEGGECRTQVCEPDSKTCVGDGVATCNKQGSGFEPEESCGDYSCKGAPGKAACDFPPPPSGALNTNGDFSNGTYSWKSVQPAPVGGEVCVLGGSRVNLEWPSSSLLNLAPELEQGKRYRLVFRVSLESTNPTNPPSLSLNLKVGGPEYPYTSFYEENWRSSSTDLEGELISREFEMTRASARAGLLITGGPSRAHLCISDIWLFEL